VVVLAARPPPKNGVGPPMRVGPVRPVAPALARGEADYGTLANLLPYSLLSETEDVLRPLEAAVRHVQGA
jgi:hypothetical protein